MAISGKKTKAHNTPRAYHPNRIGGVMVSVLASNEVHRAFEPRSGQTKVYIIGICCISAMHAALMNECKDWLTWNQNNVCQWSVSVSHYYKYPIRNSSRLSPIFFYLGKGPRSSG